MSIILNEKEWARQMIREHSLGKKPYETLCRVAKLHLGDGYNKTETRKLLDAFVLQCEPGSSLVEWSAMLDSAVKNAVRYPAIDIPYIPITEKEMDVIKSLSGTQLRRLAFTLLCISKYWDAISASNNHWSNCSDSEIMQMANISTSVRRQSQLFTQLRDLGMIRFSKRIDNLNVQVLFADDADPVHQIIDFRNLGYQYLKLTGDGYFECENCGITVKRDACQSSNGKLRRGPKQKYCKDCALSIHLRQRVNSVMRSRNK